MRKASKTSACPHCNGTGHTIDQAAIGKSMRALRVKAGKSLKEIAITLEVSSVYLCDLEFGRRRWSAERSADFKDACADIIR